MPYVPPPAPLSFEEFVAAGGRDLAFEAWVRGCNHRTTAAKVVLGFAGVIGLVIVAMALSRLA